MVREVLGRGHDPCALETLDGRGPHPGNQLRVLTVGAVADGGAVARVHDGGKVRVDAGPQELVADPNVRRLYLGESFEL